MTTRSSSAPSVTAASDDYTYDMQVHAPLPQVIEALTDDTVISRWWTAATRSERDGDEVQLFMGDGAPVRLLHARAHVRGRSEVTWTVTDCAVMADWVGTKPSFSVQPNDDGTCSIEFRHVGLRPRAGVLRPVPCRLEPLHAQPAPVPRDRRRPTERASRHVALIWTKLRSRPPHETGPMNNYTIERDIEIDAPVEVVWRTITEPELIRTWFSDAADVEARPGAVGSLTFRADTRRAQRRRHHGRRRRSSAPLLVSVGVSARRARDGSQLDARHLHARRGRRRADPTPRRRNRPRPNGHDRRREAEVPRGAPSRLAGPGRPLAGPLCVGTFIVTMNHRIR